jgi:hypothetical protein
MHPKLIFISLIAATMAMVFSGCLVRREVTSGGRTIQDNYVVKRPLKEAIENSQ